MSWLVLMGFPDKHVTMGLGMEPLASAVTATQSHHVPAPFSGSSRALIPSGAVQRGSVDGHVVHTAYNVTCHLMPRHSRALRPIHSRVLYTVSVG
jgi:hypothetical protein